MKFLLAVVLSGILLFIWGAVSHEVVPLYKDSLMQFTNEDAVTQAILSNAAKSGVYFLPYVPQSAKGMNKEAFAASQEKAMNQLKHGPFFFGSVRLEESKSLAAYFVIQIMGDILCAFFLALILLKCNEQSYWKRVMICVWVALAGFAVKSLPMWNWYSFSAAFTFAELIDITGRMFFGSLILAKMIPSRRLEA